MLLAFALLVAAAEATQSVVISNGVPRTEAATGKIVDAHDGSVQLLDGPRGREFFGHLMGYGFNLATGDPQDCPENGHWCVNCGRHLNNTVSVWTSKVRSLNLRSSADDAAAAAACADATLFVADARPKLLGAPRAGGAGKRVGMMLVLMFVLLFALLLVRAAAHTYRSWPLAEYYRSHLLYNPKTRRYVLWVQSSTSLGTRVPSFGVGSSASPDGPFPYVGVQGITGGDFGVRAAAAVGAAAAAGADSLFAIGAAVQRRRRRGLHHLHQLPRRRKPRVEAEYGGRAHHGHLPALRGLHGIRRAGAEQRGAAGAGLH